MNSEDKQSAKQLSKMFTIDFLESERSKYQKKADIFKLAKKLQKQEQMEKRIESC